MIHPPLGRNYQELTMTTTIILYVKDLLVVAKKYIGFILIINRF